MAYKIVKNKNTGKYNIFDTHENKYLLPEEYDIILDVIDDFYALIGKKSFYRCGTYLYDTYIYGLLPLNNTEGFAINYNCIYFHNNRFYCLQDGFPLCEMTKLKQFVWHNSKGTLYVNQHLLYTDDNYAIIAFPERNTDDYKRKRLFQKIDCYGNIIKEYDVTMELFYKTQNFIEDYKTDEWKDKTKGYKNIHGLCYFFLPQIWNELIEECDIHNNTARFNVKTLSNIAFSNVCICVKDDHVLLSDESCGIDEYIAILNLDGSLKYLNMEKFHLNGFYFNDSAIINNSKIIRSSTETYNLPSDIIISPKSDNNQFLRVYKGNKFGYINSVGKIIVPIIFPEDVESGFDEEIAKEEWEERQRSMLDSISDAFEGDNDNRWNID